MLLCFHVAVYIDIKTTTRYEELLKKINKCCYRTEHHLTTTQFYTQLKTMALICKKMRLQLFLNLQIHSLCASKTTFFFFFFGNESYCSFQYCKHSLDTRKQRLDLSSDETIFKRIANQFQVIRVELAFSHKWVVQDYTSFVAHRIFITDDDEQDRQKKVAKFLRFRVACRADSQDNSSHPLCI